MESPRLSNRLCDLPSSRFVFDSIIGRWRRASMSALARSTFVVGRVEKLGWRSMRVRTSLHPRDVSSPRLSQRVVLFPCLR